MVGSVGRSESNPGTVPVNVPVSRSMLSVETTVLSDDGRSGVLK